MILQQSTAEKKRDQPASMEAENKKNEEWKRMNEELFEIEEIRDMRLKNGRREYLVKWKGYPESENTWEHKKNFEDPGMPAAFEEQMTEEKWTQFYQSAISENVHPIDEILAMRVRNSSKEYLVKWKDYPESENSWLNEKDVRDPQKLADFRKKRKEELKNLEDARHKKKKKKKRVNTEETEAKTQVEVEAKTKLDCDTKNKAAIETPQRMEIEVKKKAEVEVKKNAEVYVEKKAGIKAESREIEIKAKEIERNSAKKKNGNKQIEVKKRKIEIEVEANTDIKTKKTNKEAETKTTEEGITTNPFAALGEIASWFSKQLIQARKRNKEVERNKPQEAIKASKLSKEYTDKTRKSNIDLDFLEERYAKIEEKIRETDVIRPGKETEDKKREESGVKKNIVKHVNPKEGKEIFPE